MRLATLSSPALLRKSALYLSRLKSFVSGGSSRVPLLEFSQVPVVVSLHLVVKNLRSQKNYEVVK